MVRDVLRNTTGHVRCSGALRCVHSDHTTWLTMLAAGPSSTIEVKFNFIPKTIIIPFCLGVFAVHLRTSSILLVAATKRPVPEWTAGIGALHQIVKLLRNLGFETLDFLANNILAYLVGVIKQHSFHVFSTWNNHIALKSDWDMWMFIVFGQNLKFVSGP